MNLRNKSKKNIFFIINSMHGGGAERVLANLTKELEGKYNIYLILLNKQTQYDYEAGGNIIVLDDGKKRGKFSRFIFYKRTLEKLSKEYKPEITVSFLLNACVCNIISNTNSKKILSIRNYLKKQFKGKKLKLWEVIFKCLFTKADIIVSVSKFMENDIIENYRLPKEKSKVIYNPYYIDEIISASNEEIDKKYKDIFSNRVIITVGSLHKQKGQCHLIRVFSKLKEEFKDLKLVIIGTDNSESGLGEKLKLLVKNLNLEEDIIFMGHQPNPHKYLKQSNLFVFPSLYEGFPNALVEAMICGLPVISSDCETGPREILAPNTSYLEFTNRIEYAEYGILTPTDKLDWLDADEAYTNEELMLLEAIKVVLNDEEKSKYYTKKSKERSADFSIQNIVDEWIDIF